MLFKIAVNDETSLLWFDFYMEEQIYSSSWVEYLIYSTSNGDIQRGEAELDITLRVEYIRYSTITRRINLLFHVKIKSKPLLQHQNKNKPFDIFMLRRIRHSILMSVINNIRTSSTWNKNTKPCFKDANTFISYKTSHGPCQGV